MSTLGNANLLNYFLFIYMNEIKPELVMTQCITKVVTDRTENRVPLFFFPVSTTRLIFFKKTDRYASA